MEVKAPNAKFRVICGGLFFWDGKGIHHGDFDTLPEAKNKAQEVKAGQKEKLKTVYIWNDKGELVGEAGYFDW